MHGPEEFDKPEFLGISEKVRRSAFVVAISSFGRSQLYRWVEHAYWPKIKVVHCRLDLSDAETTRELLPRLYGDRGRAFLLTPYPPSLELRLGLFHLAKD